MKSKEHFKDRIRRKMINLQGRIKEMECRRKGHVIGDRRKDNVVVIIFCDTCGDALRFRW